VWVLEGTRTQNDQVNLWCHWDDDRLSDARLIAVLCSANYELVWLFVTCNTIQNNSNWPGRNMWLIAAGFVTKQLIKTSKIF
jgi:hypothetical protein